VAATGFDLRPGDRVGRLSLAKQQQVEILRALARDAELVVLDEPTAAMAAPEVERLHDIVRTLTTGGRTVVLVSHFLREVLDLADTVTVLRDGRVVSTRAATAETEATLIASMLGRSLGRVYPVKQPPPPDSPTVLEVRDLTAPGVRAVSFDVRAGEIVGFAGLIGAGRSELVRAIYGALPTTDGAALLRGNPIPGSPKGSIGAGMALIPESRQDDGLLPRRPVLENVSLPSLDALSRLGLVRRGPERRRVRDALEQVSGSTRLEAPAVSLSGGNQQKLLFARAVLTRPGLLIADEPTRGVDVGAKRDLYALLVELAASGVGIVLVSNEMEEILGLAHRVVVMRAGSIVADLAESALTEEAILAAMFGTASAA
jgi:simple sugar transport system ATP-binding protein/ribose transport system ATP-binding protein